MKRWLLPVCALVLLLCAASAGAEAVPSVDLRRDSPDYIGRTAVSDDVTLANDETALRAVIAQIEAMMEEGVEAYFGDALFLDASGAVAESPLAGKKIALVTTVPMTVAAFVRAQEGWVTVRSAVPRVYAEILKQPDVTAVYTFLTPYGYRICAQAEYAVVSEGGKETTVYRFPEVVVRQAAGCYGMVHFVKILDER